MRIELRFFAFQADHVGRGRLLVDLPDGATAGQAVAYVRQLYPDLPWSPQTLLARNRAYVGPGEPLASGDELAIIPPVSGG